MGSLGRIVHRALALSKLSLCVRWICAREEIIAQVRAPVLERRVIYLYLARIDFESGEFLFSAQWVYVYTATLFMDRGEERMRAVF